MGRGRLAGPERHRCLGAIASLIALSQPRSGSVMRGWWRTPEGRVNDSYRMATSAMKSAVDGCWEASSLHRSGPLPDHGMRGRPSVQCGRKGRCSTGKPAVARVAAQRAPRSRSAPVSPATPHHSTLGCASDGNEPSPFSRRRSGACAASTGCNASTPRATLSSLMWPKKCSVMCTVSMGAQRTPWTALLSCLPSDLICSSAGGNTGSARNALTGCARESRPGSVTGSTRPPRRRHRRHRRCTRGSGWRCNPGRSIRKSLR
jgi:hypothetical protein